METALVIPRDPPGLNNFHQAPIGALYTASELVRRGQHVSLFDLRLDAPTSDVYEAIAGFDLVVVFATDYDLAQCYPSLSPARDGVRALREAGAARIACAGSHATVDHEMTLSFTGADTAVLGEFEFAIPELVEHLDAGAGAPRVWPLDGSTRMGGADELGGLGRPAYEMAPMDRYFSEGFVDGKLSRVRSGLVLGNRGCPFGCNFCYLLFGRRLRKRPVAATLQEMQTLRQDHGIRHFFFLDYTFTLNRKWVEELCRGMREIGLDASWVCQSRVDCLDEATLTTMRDAGCAGVWLGVESPELEQRRYLDKARFGFSDITEAVATIRRCGLEAMAFVMVGLPNETVRSLESLNRWLEESQVYYSLSTFTRRLGTPLADGAPPEGLEGDGWGYLDRTSPFLGESSLACSELEWFFDYHARSHRRVANVMRLQTASS